MIYVFYYDRGEYYNDLKEFETEDDAATFIQQIMARSIDSTMGDFAVIRGKKLSIEIVEVASKVRLKAPESP